MRDDKVKAPDAHVPAAGTSGADLRVGGLREWLRESFKRCQDRTALNGPGVQFTYADLDRAVAGLSSVLVGNDASPRPVVVALVDDRTVALIALLASVDANVVYVPLDPSVPLPRLSAIVSDLSPEFILSEARHSGLAATLGALAAGTVTRITLRTLGASSVDVATDSLSATGTGRREPLPAAASYVFYTSGSTGEPKGIIGHSPAVSHFVRWEIETFAIGPEIRTSQLVVPTFDAYLRDVLVPLCVGGTIVLPPVPVREMSADGLATWLDSERIGLVHCVPSVFRSLLHAALSPAAFPELRHILMAGEALKTEEVRRWRDVFGDRVALVNLYGSTETTMVKFFHVVRPTDLERESIPIGRPMRGATALIVDDAGRPCPAGVPGEILIGGADLALGYFGNRELTERAFVRYPFNAAPDQRTVRVYRTGDYGLTTEDGTYLFRGRRDNQIKLRGVRVELGEIESVLAQHPAVHDVVVLAREDSPGNQQLVGYVVAREGHAVNDRDLRLHAAALLPEYMVPAAIMLLERLPLTPNGKVDRRALPALPVATTAVYEAPRTELERTVAGIWGDVLRAPRVGVHDDFFELGGHSLVAVQMIARLRAALGVDVPVRSLFEARTLSRFAALVATSRDAGPGPAPMESIALDDAHRFDPFSLTDVQQAYWVGRRTDIDMGGVATQSYLEVEFPGLDLDRFRSAVRALVSRHDMLRAIVRDDGLQQVLESVPELPIAIHDLRGETPVNVERSLLATRARLSHLVLPTNRWPLYSLEASLLDGDVVLLHCNVDTLFSDAFSRRIMMRDLLLAYAQPDGARRALEITFRDYVVAEERLRDTPAYARSLAYWKSRAETLPAGPALPRVPATRSVDGPRFSRLGLSLTSTEWAALKRNAAVVGVTPSVALIAAFALVLGRWSRGAAFTLNLTLFNRIPMHPDIQELIGDFTSLTLLEIESAGDGSFAALSRKIQDRLWTDLDHRAVGGVRVLREIRGIDGGQARQMPIVFTSTLGFDSDWRVDGSSLSYSLRYGITQTPQVWLDCQVSENQGVLTVNWDFLEHVFPDGTLGSMFAAFRALLGSLQSAETWSGAACTALRYDADLSARREANSTSGAIPAGLLHEPFAVQARARPDAPAVITSRISMSYGELDARADRLARRLQSLGVAPGEPVAIVMEKGWEQVVAVLGVLRAGAFYVPIDAAVPPARLARVLELSGARVAATQPQYESTAAWPAMLTRVVVEREEVSASDPRFEPVHRAPEDLAYVIFTSGSTGEPKGVMIDHRGALNTVIDVNERLQLDPDDRILAVSSLWFDLSVYDIFGALACGAAIVVPDAASSRDPAHWAGLVARHRVTIWNSVPALVDLLVDYVASRPGESIASLRAIMMSGDWIPVRLPDRIRSAVPNARQISMGGATEASIWSIWYPIERVESDWTSIPYGRPMKNQSFHVFDRSFEPAPTWVAGDLFIGGIGLAKGYWRDDAKTAATFVRHPHSGERLYRTGDLGRYLPDGTIEFLGREDAQVKIQGYRVELGEIESVLQNHPSVREVVVAARKDGSVSRLVAYVVPADGVRVEPVALREHAKQALPEYMVPALYVTIEALPLSSNGKVDRKRLPAPSDEAFAAESPARAVSPRAREVAEIISGIVGVDVAPHANLFEIGANSVDLIRGINAIEKRYGVRPALRDVLRDPTPAAIGTLIDSSAPAPDAEREEGEI